MIDELGIRKAISTDLPRVQQCAHDAYLTYVVAIGRRPAPMVADFGEQITRGIVYVAETDGEIVGYIVFYPQERAGGENNLFVENIAVSPSVAGRGIGTALMNHAAACAKESGLSSIRLYTNAKMLENLRWYPKIGYRETGRVTEDGFDRVYFEKGL